MNSRFLHRGIPIIAGVALLAMQAAVAQTPATDDQGCQLSPLELPLFGGTPAATIASTPASSLATPVDASEEDIRAALDQFVACTNTGDPALAWAMFTPRLLASVFTDPQVHYLPAFEQMLDGPMVVAEPPLELVEMGEIESLPDGRVEVTATYRSGDSTWTDTLTLVNVDGQWLIDGVRLDTSAP